MADGSIIIDTKLDKTDLDKQLSNLKGSLQNTTDSLNSMTKTAAIGFAALGAAIAPAIKLASDLAESANAAKVVFGDASKTIEEFGKVAAEQAGLTSSEFNQMAAQIGASLINAGQSQEDAAKQSVELTKRAADMASIFNTDVSEALTAIQAGLRGESEPLRRFAVGLDEASVAAKAVEMGLAKSVSSVDAYGKSQARMALIMEQSSKFQGDFVNTSDQLANSTRITTAMIKEQAAQAGSVLLPIVLDVVKGFLTWAKEGDRLANIMKGVANSIKWATESGLAQGILAAAAALGIATAAMSAFVAVSTMTPGAGILLGISLLIGGIVGIGTAAMNAKKEQDELNKALSKTSELGRDQQIILLEKRKEEYQDQIKILNLQRNAEAQAKGTSSERYKRLDASILDAMAEQGKISARQQELAAEIRKIQSAPSGSTGGATGGTGGTSGGLAQTEEQRLAAIKKVLDAEQKLREMEAENATAIQKKRGADALRIAKEEQDALAKQQADFAEIQEAGWKKILANALRMDPESLGKRVINGIIKGIRGALPQMAKIASKVITIIGSVLSNGAAIIGDVVGGLVSIIESVANFDPAETYLKLTEFVEDIKEFFSVNLALSPVFFEAGAKIVSELIRGLDSNLPNIYLLISGALNSIVSTIASYGPSMAASFTTVMAAIILAISESLPSFVIAASGIITSILGGINANASMIVTSLANTVVSMLSTITSSLPQWLVLGGSIILKITDGIAVYASTIGTKLSEMLINGINTIAAMTPQLIASGTNVVVGLVSGIGSNAYQLVDSVIALVNSFVGTIGTELPKLIFAGGDLITNLVNGVILNSPDILPASVKLVTDFINGMLETATRDIPEMTATVIDMIITSFMDDPLLLATGADIIGVLISGMIDGLTNSVTIIGGGLQTIIDAIINFFANPQKSLETIGSQIAAGFQTGFLARINTIWTSVKTSFENLIKSVKTLFGIASPSKVFAQIGGFLAEGIGVGINDTDIFGMTSGTFGGLTDQAKAALGSVQAGLSGGIGNIAASVTGQSALSAVANQMINIVAPVTIDGREVARASFRYTDSNVRMAYGS